MVGRIPLWVLFYLFIVKNVSVGMFLTAVILVIFSRIYIDATVFKGNPFISVFSILFHSFFKPILYIGVFVLTFAGVLIYFLSDSILFVLVPAFLAGIVLAGADIFFRKDFLNSLWGYKNLLTKDRGVLLKWVIILSWILIVTTPVYISISGFFVVYIIELGNFHSEIESIL